MTKENRPHEEGGTRSGGPAEQSTAPLRDVSADARFVKVPSLEYIELVIDAGQWRTLRESPHVAGLLDEWSEWDRRRQLRQSSWDISETSRGRWDHVSYAEIERRRNKVQVPEWALSGNARLARKRGEAA